MKKSVEILGLPIISITEGFELGMSKTLLIDAKNGLVAAITIEDEDWYRGVKLIPYESVIAIGDDAVTVTNSENILKLDEAGDYESLLDENIRVIGTKAITKNGTIQGKISELFIGDNGKIEKCEITAPDGTTSEVTADQISIFGKQVTVIDAEKKTEFITETPAPEPIQAEEEISATASNDSDFGAVSVPEEIPAALESVMTPEPTEEIPQVTEEIPQVEEEKTSETLTQQAEALKAALKRAMANQQKMAAEKEAAAAQSATATEKAVDDRRRRLLLGKKAARTIKADNGIVIVEEGADITEEVLQKAKLANKFMDLSMNYI